jgi:hypothetical protein
MPGTIAAKLVCGFRVSILLTALGIPTAFAQQDPAVSQETVLTYVHDFLQVFYPELLSKEHTLKLCVNHPADDSWREITGVYFTVTHERAPDYGVPRFSNGQRIPEDRPDPNTILLAGSIWLPLLEHRNRIQEMHTSAEGAVNLKFANFRSLVQSHPEWTDAEAVIELKKEGARFGPNDKEAFVQALPMRAADRFLGSLKIMSVEFKHLADNSDGNFALTAFDWAVRCEAKSADGTTVVYVFGFEPFEGKLTSLFRIG